MSGSDIAYGGMSLCQHPTRSYAVSGTHVCGVRYWHSVCPFAVCGTEIVYAPSARGAARESGREYPVTCPATCLHPEIPYKKPHFQYNLYQPIAGTAYAIGLVLGAAACPISLRAPGAMSDLYL
eukprot:1001712-Rhodomonas_salina.1